MRLYVYDGPVVEFDRCVENRWHGETIAPSERKAKSNLCYQWKKKNNRVAGTKVSLPNKLIVKEVYDA